MTSQESLNKNEEIKHSDITFLSLLKEDLRCRRWMLVLSAVVQFLLGPIVTLFAFSRRTRFDMVVTDPDYAVRAMGYARDMVTSYTEKYLPVIQLIIAVTGALIVGIGGFRHLFNRRMTDMVCSVPVKKEKQFAVIFTNGFLIWLIPAAISIFLSMVVTAVKFASYGLASTACHNCLFVLLGAAFTFLIAYSLVILAVTLSGTMINAVLNIAFIGFDLIVGYWLVYVLCQDNFANFMDYSLGFLNTMWISSPISAVIWGYDIATPSFSLIDEYESLGWYIFSAAATIATGVANIVLSLIIYVKRKSEESESGVSNRPYRFLTRTINSIYAGLILSVIIFDIMGYYGDSVIGWQFFFTILFSFLAYGLIEMIHSRSFKGFFAHKIQMALTVLASAFVLAIFLFDLTNYDNRIIPESSIKSARIGLSLGMRGDDGWGYETVPGERGYLRRIEGVNLHRGEWMVSPEIAYRISTAPKFYYKWDGLYIYDPLTKKKEGPVDDSRGAQYISLVADRTVGLDFMRNYRVLDEELVDEIVESDGYLETMFPLETGVLGYPEELSVEGVGEYMNVVVPDEMIPELMEAYYKDFNQNASADSIRTDYTEDIVLNLIYKVEIPPDEMKYYAGDPETGKKEYYNCSFRIYVKDTDAETYKVLNKYFGIEPDMDEDVYIEDFDGDSYELYSF